MLQCAMHVASQDIDDVTAGRDKEEDEADKDRTLRAGVRPSAEEAVDGEVHNKAVEEPVTGVDVGEPATVADSAVDEAAAISKTTQQ